MPGPDYESFKSYVMEQKMIQREEEIEREEEDLDNKAYEDFLREMEKLPDDVEVCNHSTIFGPLEITMHLRKLWVGNKHEDIVKLNCPCKKQHVPICAIHMQNKKGCDKKDCEFLHPDNMLGVATNWHQLYTLNNELCTKASDIGVDVSLMKFAS